jgi:hypothetical protein
LRDEVIDEIRKDTSDYCWFRVSASARTSRYDAKTYTTDIHLPRGTSLAVAKKIGLLELKTISTSLHEWKDEDVVMLPVGYKASQNRSFLDSIGYITTLAIGLLIAFSIFSRK